MSVQTTIGTGEVNSLSSTPVEYIKNNWEVVLMVLGVYGVFKRNKILIAIGCYGGYKLSRKLS